MQGRIAQKQKARIGAAILVSAALIFTAGCSGSGESSSAGESAAPGGGAMEKINRTGEMVVGVKFDTPPYGSIAQGESEPEGFDIDLATEVAKRLGVEPKFVEAKTGNRIPYLQSGRVDLIAASTVHTKEREKAVDFSVNYFEDLNRLLVPAGSSIEGIDDLAGKKIALVQGAQQEAIIRKLAPEAEIVTYQEWPSTIQAMLRGEADGVVSSTGILVGLQQRAKDAGEDVEIVGEGFSAVPVGMAMLESNPDLRDAVNLALMDIYEDGTYAEIFEKWWGSVFDDVYEIETWVEG